MTPDQLRALAEALDKITPVMGLEELHHMATLDRAADFLRQCAEQRPDGWQLVPVEPTEAMKSAGGHVNSEWLNDDAPLCESRYAMPMDGVWSAMLAAAPAAPQAEPKRDPSEKQIADACYRYRHDFGLLDKYEQDCVVNEARRWADAFGIGGSDE